MPTIFLPCEDHDASVLDMAAKLMDTHYRELREAGVTVCYLFASNPEAIGGCLKHQGYFAAATIKVNSLKCRVEGKKDLTVTIDREWWEQHDKAECLALLDHELHHALLGYDDDGKVIVDDIGRPKIKLKLHDWQHGGFYEVVKRHGLAAEEAKGIMNVQKEFAQRQFDFGGAWG